MKEIGGYFQLEQYRGKEFYEDLIALNTARNALVYILKAQNINKVYIPSYLCSSVRKVLERENVLFEYYGVGRDFLPIFDKELQRGECLYLVNYYGALECEQIVELKERYDSMILDNSHAFFQKAIRGIDTIYNCRKFFGVPDGAYLATNVLVREELGVDYSYKRMEHILGRYDKTAQEFYHSFKQVEDSFAELPLMYMSRLTHNLMKGIDYAACIDIRTRNYAEYQKKLGDMNGLKLNIIRGAYVYPFYTKDAQEIRGEMIANNIYIPTLWPDVAERVCEEDMVREYAQLILPLPCDHRMGTEDVKKVIGFILNKNGL